MPHIPHYGNSDLPYGYVVLNSAPDNDASAIQALIEDMTEAGR